MLLSDSRTANCPAADATTGGSSGFKLGFKFSIPGLLQSCCTSQLPNPALPPGQPEQSEIQVEGWALADDIMADWRWGGARSVSPQV